MTNLGQAALNFANSWTVPAVPEIWDRGHPRLYPASLAVLLGEELPRKSIDIPKAALGRFAIDFTGTLKALHLVIESAPESDSYVFEPITGVRVVLSPQGQLMAVTSAWLFLNVPVDEVTEDDGLIFGLQPAAIVPAHISSTFGLCEGLVGEGEAPAIHRGKGQDIQGTAIRFPAVMLGIWDGSRYYDQSVQLHRVAVRVDGELRPAFAQISLDEVQAFPTVEKPIA